MAPSTIHLLVVEDDPDQLTALQRFLVTLGYRVHTACSARIALRTLREISIDLVITDLIMEDYDGLDFIQDLRHSGSDIRIIAVSGGGSMPAAPLLTAAGRLGAHAAFQKPISPSVLESTIKRLLHSRPKASPDAKNPPRKPGG